MKLGLAGWLVVGSICLSGCTLLIGEPEEQDRGPSSPVDLSNVQEPVPRIEPRTRAGNKTPYTVLGRTYHLLEDETSYKERGMASWYGQKFHGRKTANGETYDMYAMTAAHKTLPIPSYVRVTHLENGRSVVVRVNDRGPFHDRRVIDLSYAAADRLGFAKKGVAPVEVEIIVPNDQPPPPLDVKKPMVELNGGTFIQVGAYSSEKAAQAQADEMAALTEQDVVVHFLKGAPELYRVRIGPLSSEDQINSVRERLQSVNITQAHIVSDNNDEPEVQR